MRPVIHRVNRTRIDQGLLPLRYSYSLALSARLFGRHLANRPLAHDATIHVDKRWWWAGEVLARGQTSVDEVVDDWLNSPPHRAILLNPRARRMGAYHHKPSDTWVGHLGRLGR